MSNGASDNDSYYSTISSRDAPELGGARGLVLGWHVLLHGVEARLDPRRGLNVDLGAAVQRDLRDILLPHQKLNLGAAENNALRVGMDETPQRLPLE